MHVQSAWQNQKLHQRNEISPHDWLWHYDNHPEIGQERLVLQSAPTHKVLFGGTAVTGSHAGFQDGSKLS